jgi:hypothetical protein
VRDWHEETRDEADCGRDREREYGRLSHRRARRSRDCIAVGASIRDRSEIAALKAANERLLREKKLKATAPAERRADTSGLNRYDLCSAEWHGAHNGEKVKYYYGFQRGFDQMKVWITQVLFEELDVSNDGDGGLTFAASSSHKQRPGLTPLEQCLAARMFVKTGNEVQEMAHISLQLHE